MFKCVFKSSVAVLAVPFILAGCGSGSGSGNVSSGNSGVGSGDVLPSQPGSPGSAGGDFQIRVNERCVASGARVLVNDASGNLIRELTADSQGYVSLRTVPDDGSIGVVHSYKIGTVGLPDFTTVSHVDKQLLENVTAVSVISPLTRCLDLTSPGLFTVSASNGGNFDLVSFSGAGTAGYDQYTVNSGNVVALGYSSGVSSMYGIGSSAVAPGSTVPIRIERNIRQVTWQASGATPSNVEFAWAAGDTFAVISSKIPSGATSGMLEMVAEPGLLVAEASYTAIDPFAGTGYTVIQNVVGASLTESSVEFAGVALSDVTSLALSNGSVTYQYTGQVQIKSATAAAAGNNIRHSYSTSANLGRIDLPELPSDLQSKLGNVSDISLRLESDDPTTYSAVFGVLSSRVNGQLVQAPYIDKVKYEYTQSFIN
jgi:hypothetical protein